MMLQREMRLHDRNAWKRHSDILAYTQGLALARWHGWCMDWVDIIDGFSYYGVNLLYKFIDSILLIL